MCVRVSIGVRVSKMVYFMKPMQWLNLTLTSGALILYIIVMSSASWYYVNTAGSQFGYGPFRACASIFSYQIDECRRVDNSCNADFSLPLGTMPIFGSCDRLLAIKSLGLISLFSTGFALLPMLATAWIAHDLALRLVSSFWSFLAAACGLITMAVFADQNLPSRSQFGYAFALLVAAWVLNFICAIAALFPSPVTLPATSEMTKGGQMGGNEMYVPGTARPSISQNTYPNVQPSAGQQQSALV